MVEQPAFILVVYLVVLLLIGSRRMPRLTPTLAGAGLVLLTHYVAASDLRDALTPEAVDVVLFALGMNLFVNFARRTGLYTYLIAARLSARGIDLGRGFRDVLLLALGIGALGGDRTFLYAVVPLFCLLCDSYGIDHGPLRSLLAGSTVLGGMLFAAGSLEAMILAAAATLSPVSYLAHLLPGLAIPVLLVLLAARNEVAAALRDAPEGPPSTPRRLFPERTIPDPDAFGLVYAIGVLTILVLLAGPSFGLAPGTIVFAAAALLLLWLRCPPLDLPSLEPLLAAVGLGILSVALSIAGVYAGVANAVCHLGPPPVVVTLGLLFLAFLSAEGFGRLPALFFFLPLVAALPAAGHALYPEARLLPFRIAIGLGVALATRGTLLAEFPDARRPASARDELVPAEGSPTQKGLPWRVTAGGLAAAAAYVVFRYHLLP